MKFLVTWRIHDEHRHDALKTFSEMTADDERADLGDSVNLIGRWHDLVAILDAEVIPVLDDDEARAVGRARS